MYSQIAFAQQMPEITSAYLFNSYFVNPAYAGAEGEARITTFFQKVNDQIPRSPYSAAAMFDGKIKNTNSALGCKVLTDQYSYSKTISFSGSYTHQFFIDNDKKHKLALGLSAGFFSRSIDYSNSEEAKIDPQLMALNGNSVVLDVGAGAYYAYEQFKFSISVLQLPGVKSEIASNSLNYTNPYNLNPIYFMGVSYKFRLEKGKDIHFLEPNLMFSWQSGLSTVSNISFLYHYKKNMGLMLSYKLPGISYLETSSLALGAWLNAFNKTKVGYLFRTSIGSEARSSLGNSHEITVQFIFPYRR
jgi:type IX secretion system PorP/SprF family membrane protein